MIKDWNQCMGEINKAVSRYDGHTTYAKMENIVGILVNPLFDEKPACYVAEIIPEIQKMLGKSEDEDSTTKRVAAEAHIRHCMSLGLLESIVSGGGTSHHGIRSKIDETMRIALTFLGRVCRAAIKQEDKDFEKFLLTYALLEHDFDMYGLLIKVAAVDGGRSTIKDNFVSETKKIYRERKQWLEKSSTGIRNQFQKYTSDESRSNRTLQHHFNLRLTWAKSLDHISKSNGEVCITSSGKQLATLIHGRIKAKNSMFWIAPTAECIKKTGIVSKQAEQVFSAWDILRPPAEALDSDDEIIRKTAEFMKSAYKHIRLRIFNQAPIGAIIPYVHFLEYKLDRKVDIKKTFHGVLRKYRDDFSCMLGAVPQKSVYQLRVPKQ